MPPPLWTDRAAVESLVRAIAEVRHDGLDSEDYGLSALRGAAGREHGSWRGAELDLLSTNAFVQISRDLRFGKVEPRGPPARPTRRGPSVVPTPSPP